MYYNRNWKKKRKISLYYFPSWICLYTDVPPPPHPHSSFSPIHHQNKGPSYPHSPSPPSQPTTLSRFSPSKAHLFDYVGFYIAWLGRRSWGSVGSVGEGRVNEYTKDPVFLNRSLNDLFLQHVFSWKRKWNFHQKTCSYHWPLIIFVQINWFLNTSHDIMRHTCEHREICNFKGFWLEYSLTVTSM